MVDLLHNAQYLAPWIAIAISIVALVRPSYEKRKLLKHQGGIWGKFIRVIEENSSPFSPNNDTIENTKEVLQLSSTLPYSAEGVRFDIVDKEGNSVLLFKTATIGVIPSKQTVDMRVRLTHAGPNTLSCVVAWIDPHGKEHQKESAVTRTKEIMYPA